IHVMWESLHGLTAKALVAAPQQAMGSNPLRRRAPASGAAGAKNPRSTNRPSDRCAPEDDKQRAAALALASDRAAKPDPTAGVDHSTLPTWRSNQDRDRLASCFCQAACARLVVSRCSAASRSAIFASASDGFGLSMAAHFSSARES